MTDTKQTGEKPHRVQRKRTKGWKMPPNTVSVTRPGKWGNPFTLKQMIEDGQLQWELVKESRKYDSIFDLAIELSIQNFRAYIEFTPEYSDEVKRELKGKNLACFCPLDQPCHADVLLEIANK